MADNIKQASFRLTEDDVVKFREIADQQGLNQAEMFQSLLNSFEMAKAKGQITDRGKEIETFQGTVNTLVSMFVSSLAINQTSEERIRETLSLELHTKDTTIKDLQEEKTKYKEELKVAKEELESKDKAAKEIESKLNSLNKDLLQKNNTIDSLQSQLNTLNSIVDEYKGFKDTNTILESNIKELSNINANLISKNTDMKFQLDNEVKMKEFFENQIQSLREALDTNNQERKILEQEHKVQLEVLKIEFNNKFENEIQKYKNDFNEKLSFEKEKMQLLQDKISNELEANKAKYNEVQEKYVQQNLLIEKLENAQSNKELNT